MTRVAGVVIGLSLLASTGFAQDRPTFFFDSFTSIRGVWTEGQSSWLEGGFGRLMAGAETSHDDKVEAFGNLRLGLQWDPTEHFGIVVNGVARAEPDEYLGDPIGLVEGFIEGRLFFGEPVVGATSSRLRLRAGTYFLPTSRENTDFLWMSPYTITWSAINTWMGEEIRPAGLDVDYRITTPNGHDWTVAGTVFGGNDTMGTLLAWRGWAMGNRLTVWDETLPLPPLFSLEDDGALFMQRDDGTTPFTEDFDDTAGWSARARWSIPDRMSIQYTRLDNRADPSFFESQGEYGWHTDWDHLGIDFHPTPGSIIAAEWIEGYTAMGPPFAVRAEFGSWYVLGSVRLGDWRFSARYDDFFVEDLDDDFRAGASSHHLVWETNDDDGQAVTLAAFWLPNPSLRFGIELVDLSSNRIAAAESGFDPNTDGRTVTLELRYYWGGTR